MTFRYSERHRDEYYGDGLTVLRDLIPASLLADLRRETDTAREIARRKFGPQCQRLQPVYPYPELDARRFRDFLELPGLRATVENILGADHRPSDILGVLFEPAETAWATHWHRDWGYNVPGIDVDAFFHAAIHKPGMFNQLNAALYADASLWVVPGSHDRMDTPEEQAAFGGVPPSGPLLDDAMSPEERELTCFAIHAARCPARCRWRSGRATWRSTAPSAGTSAATCRTTSGRRCTTASTAPTTWPGRRTSRWRQQRPPRTATSGRRE
jgi:hypothetical protein